MRERRLRSDSGWEVEKGERVDMPPDEMGVSWGDGHCGPKGSDHFSTDGRGTMAGSGGVAVAWRLDLDSYAPAGLADSTGPGPGGGGCRSGC